VTAQRQLWSTSDKHASLVATLPRVLAAHGNGIWEPDALLAAVHRHCDAGDRDWWAVTHRAGELVGLATYLNPPAYQEAFNSPQMRGERSILQELCVERGVLIWAADGYPPYGSTAIRLVDVKWKKSAKDICEHVSQVSARGRPGDCMFCGISEWTDARNPCAPRPMLPKEPFQHLVHFECSEHWNHWQSVAGEYAVKARTKLAKAS